SANSLTLRERLPRIGQISTDPPMFMSPNALRNGFLTLWLVVLVGCQTTTGPAGHSTVTKSPPTPAAQTSADARASAKSRWRIPQRIDEPRTLWTRIRDGF